MKMVLLLAALMLSAVATPVFAQAPNDRASVLQSGRAYTHGRHAARVRARAARHAMPPAMTPPAAKPQ